MHTTYVIDNTREGRVEPAAQARPPFTELTQMQGNGQCNTGYTLVCRSTHVQIVELAQTSPFLSRACSLTHLLTSLINLTVLDFLDS